MAWIIPTQVLVSNEVIVGDMEKFFELYESGYYAEQYDRLLVEATTRFENEALSALLPPTGDRRNNLGSGGSVDFDEYRDETTESASVYLPTDRDGDNLPPRIDQVESGDIG